MTSLSRQLETLRVAASAQLAVERPHVSLLFSKKEAASLYKEDVLKIGQSGLAQLRKIDPQIAREEEELFADTALTTQRALLTKDENERLNRLLERVLAQISPYLLHFAAQQVLEWLIHRFQINSFNGKTVFIMFLPFHNTKIFARLLSVLDLKGIEYDWVREYGKMEAPIPFERLVVKCFSANHSLLSMICQNIEDIIDLLGDEYAEKKLPHFFTLYAKLGVYLVHDSTKVNDTLISKMVPFLATSLKSRLASLRLASLMIASQLCMSVTLTSAIIHSLLKMIFLKITAPTMTSTLDTAIMICQRQDVKILPVKGIKKLVRKDEELKISPYIAAMAKKTDLSKFLAVLWSTLLPLFNESVEDEDLLTRVETFMLSCLDVELLDGHMATALFSSIFENLGNDIGQISFPEKLGKQIRSIVLRFGLEFDAVCAEWKVRDERVIKSLLNMCKIEAHEVGNLSLKSGVEKKRRRRTSSCRKSFSEAEPSETVQTPTMSRKKLAKLQAKAQIESLRETVKEKFHGDPLEKLASVIDEQQWEKAILGFEKVASDKFLKRHDSGDFEEFIATMVRRATTDAVQVKANIRTALAKLPISSDFACILLKKTSLEPVDKRPRGRRRGQANYFEDETDSDFEKRLVFVLEILNANVSVATSAKLLSTVFLLLKEPLRNEEGPESSAQYLQQLAISLIVRMIRSPVNYVVTKEDLQMDCVVEIIRNTFDQRTLRDCLRLLTAAVKISPSDVLSQIMSVFTFMGSGLLRKDNELTLGIIEETLSVLFSAVMHDNDKELNDRLISVSRIFAASVVDIPAHRRIRILHAVAKAATAKHLWAVIAVLFEQFCANYQRNVYVKGRTNVEQFEEMATEMISLYDGGEQLMCAVELVEHIVYLGGDAEEGKKKKISLTLYEKLFDRSKYTLQKLRHYRFTVIGWIARLLSSKELFEKLSGIDDEAMYDQLVVVGKRLLVCSMELDDFVTLQTENSQNAEMQADPASAKYWAAVTSRADVVAEKFRNLLPSSVCGRLIADILADKNVEPKMRDRALQLLNVKLMQDGLFHKDGGIRTEHLVQFAQKLIVWIKPVESKDEVLLCQNAAFSLRLLARRLPSTEGTAILSECIQLSNSILKQWRSLDEALIGNVFLLAGEIFKFHNMRSTLLASDSVVPLCLDVINQQLDLGHSLKSQESIEASTSQEAETRSAKRKRVAQQSMSGRRIGGDTLLVCGLTCLQRILDQFAQYVSAHLVSILTTLSMLSARFDPRFDMIGSNDKAVMTKTHPIQYRICQIRKAMTKVELRVILEPFEQSCQKLLSEPKAMVFLFSLYSSCLEAKERLMIVKVLNPFCNFVFSAFCLRASNPSPEAYEVVAGCESRMIISFLSVMECLSENDLRPIMLRLYKWSEPALKSAGGVEVRSRLVSAFNIVNGFYDSYNTLALPHFGRIFDLVPRILKRMNGRANDVDSLLFAGQKGTFEALEGNTLLTLVIDFVAKCAKHPEFFSEERAHLVLDPLVDELENSVISGHEDRCSPHLADCLLNIADTQNDLITEMFNKIMLKLRDRSAKIRYRTLLVLERMFSRMGEAVAPLLPSVLPFLSELLEDEHKKVEEQCDKVLTVLRKNFGEDIAEGYA